MRRTAPRGKKRIALLAVVIALTSGALTGLGGLVARAAGEEVDNSVATDLSTCLSEKRRLSVLWLIDQSRSLKENDRFGLRTIPLTATAQVLAAIASSDATEKIELQASVVGFGNGANLKLDWTEVTEQSVEAIEKVLDAESRVQEDYYTQYNRALSAAIQQFSKPETLDSCRVAFWFSDGEHDFDNISGLSAQEERQVRSEICGPGGLADQLREARIQLWSVGLNPKPEKLELMHLVSENDGSYRSGGIEVGSGQCGTLPARGRYVSVADADRIAEVFTNFPGLPTDEVTTSSCGVGECSEIRFTADASISGFKMRLTRPSKDVSVELRLPDQQSVKLFSDNSSGVVDRNREQRVGPIRVIRISSNESLVIARADARNRLEGDWLVQFIGEGAESAEGRISFEGDVRISIVDDEGTPLDIIDRFEPVPIRVSVLDGSGTRNLNPSKLLVTIAGTGSGADKRVSLPVELENGFFRVSSRAVAEALKGDLKSELAVEFSAIPEATIEGLRGPNDESIPVVFRQSSVVVGVSNGKNYPTYLPQSDQPEVKVTDTEEFSVSFRFRGPDAVDGEVRVVGFGEGFPNENEFSIEGDNSCVVPAQTEVNCSFLVVPGKNGYGPVSIPLQLVLDSSKAESEQPQSVAVDVFMTRNPDVGKGVRNAIILVAGFLLVQLLIRLLTALALSRFESLDSTARRIRVPVRVFADGSVTGRDRTELVAADAGTPDNMFASELLERQRNFNIFGYEFASSVVKIFFRPMTRPLGEVGQPGMHVIGSAGASVPKGKQIQSGFSKGRVELSLRRQWAVGLTSAEVLRLESTSDGVEGELIALLDPIEVVSVTDQLSDLQVTISGSQLGSDLGLIAERLRDASSRDESVGELPHETRSVEGGFHVESSGTPDPFVMPDDPFGGVTGALSAQEVSTEEPKKKRGRKNRGESDSNGESGTGFTFDSNDPFS